MSVVINNTVKDARAQALLNAIDQAVGAADIQIGTSGFVTLLVTIPFADPAGTVASQAITFSGMPRVGTAVATGTAAEARIRDAAGTIIVSGLTVGTVSTDVVLNTTSITNASDVQINSATITEG